MFCHTSISACTTIDLKEYANEKNHYDSTKMHPANHTIVVITENGDEYSCSVMQLGIFLEYASRHPHMGSALDAVAMNVPKN